ncbi:ABC transporter substrate-binding protein [Paenibacillus baekrokdamisoli]|uniref:ABC transporter substrate-binding protein n=1 Tax=Paenibacillus baekrokdamisoli TaxID=1712516 RepID=A0A3G9IJF7_9BACL|nr:extracellular solute-binding protein [Paenibacillus baekrokdamisoli]MBB3067677.1 raffinose/stachyose/melibiose transport system substrate-binding protein [Paenibacillus baekrokdamisoli]BBH19137.1 ABC transporter substrate-binding protein [Paenibacillus baekrokdamisoli]
MKLKKGTALITAVMLMTALTLSACSSGSNESATPNDSSTSGSGDKVNIVFWNSGYATIDENNKSKKKEDFYISQAVARYEKAHPNVTIDVQDIPSGDQLFAKFQTASIANNGPDMTVLWSGTYMLRFKQFLEPMDSYFTSEERSRIVGWNAVTEDFKTDGKAYGVPFQTDGTFVLAYNKKIFADAGVDPIAQRPKNFQEFVAMLDKIKSKEVTPLGLFKDSFLHVPDYWIAQTVDTSGLDKLVKGKMDFSDPKLVNVMKGWRELFAKDLVIADDSIRQLFIQGQLGMAVGANSDILTYSKEMGDNLGIMKLPDFSEDVKIHDGGPGGVGAAFVVTNYSEHKKETADFIKFLMSKDEQINKIKSGEARITVVNDVDVNQYDSNPLVKQMQDMANEPSTIFWPDNVYPAELTSEMMSLQSLVSNGKMSAEDFMKKIDKKRNEVLKSAQ